MKQNKKNNNVLSLRVDNDKKNNNVLSLRVDNGIRRIEVNDDGEFIDLSINDSGLMARFAKMIENLDAKQPELAQFDKEMAEKYPGGDIQRRIEVSKKTEEVYRYCMDEIDKVFGLHTCEKVFGKGIVANDYMISQFLDQMQPILRALKAERDANIKGKYERRTGASVMANV